VSSAAIDRWFPICLFWYKQISGAGPGNNFYTIASIFIILFFHSIERQSFDRIVWGAVNLVDFERKIGKRRRRRERRIWWWWCRKSREKERERGKEKENQKEFISRSPVTLSLSLSITKQCALVFVSLFSPYSHPTKFQNEFLYFFLSYSVRKLICQTNFLGGFRVLTSSSVSAFWYETNKFFTGRTAHTKNKFLLFLFTRHGTYGRGRKYGQ
jgi:hypothetical protein